MKSHAVLIALATIASCSLTARAGFIYHDSATTSGGEFSASFPIGNLKNAGHASSTDTENAAAANESYATMNTATFPVTITLDFVNAVDLAKFHLWNHSNNNGGTAPNAGIKDFTLTFYDGVGGTGSQIGAVFSSTATAAPATGTYAAQTFNFGSTYNNVRSVKLVIINRVSGTGFVALREIGFEGTITPIAGQSPDKVIVYLVGGQSNADGYGITSSLSPSLKAPRPDIDFYHGNGGGNSPLPANQWIPLQPGSGSMAGNAGGFGPELNFGIGIHQALGSQNARIAVIKRTRGATNLHTDWFPGGNATTTGDGPDYQAFQTTVNSALASLASLYPGATIQLEGMIWHQGEADAGSATNADAYQTNLTNFISDIRATYGSGLKFGIVQLSNNQTHSSILVPYGLNTVKAAQAAVAGAAPLNYLVTTDDLPATSTAIHFGTASVLTIGSRLAAGMQRVPITDTDGNGLDDDWEEDNWGVGNTGQDAGGDEDKDGLTNLGEFLWLTNPRASNVISPTLQTSPALSITWPSSPNRRYLIEASPDLNSWQRLDSFIRGSAGATTSYVLPADPASPRRFFRIGVQR
jgi:hypothetical protein